MSVVMTVGLEGINQGCVCQGIKERRVGEEGERARATVKPNVGKGSPTLSFRNPVALAGNTLEGKNM